MRIRNRVDYSTVKIRSNRKGELPSKVEVPTVSWLKFIGGIILVGFISILFSKIIENI